MQQWVNDTVAKHNITQTFIFSGCMAQFVMPEKMASLRKVTHFVDIDSDKWGQYADKTKGIMRWIYRREQKTLSEFEKYIAQKSSISCFVSDAETNMFKNMLTQPTDSHVETLSNGIDCDYFSPNAKMHLAENYALSDQNYVVFTGAMDYRPNIEAVVWFVDSVWPTVLNQVADAKFYIVGSSPSKQVISLSKIPGVVVTGRVDDIRPYMRHAKVSVAPIQIARGIQNKILEAMSMERPVIATDLAIEGIENYPQEGITISNSSVNTANLVSDALEQDIRSFPASRCWLKNNYSWEAKLFPLLSYLENNRD